LPKAFLINKPLQILVKDTSSMNKQTRFIGLGGFGFTVIQYIQNKEAEAIYTCVDEENIPSLSPEIHFIQCEVYSQTKRIKLNFYI
jgi:hypothetical protein